MSDANLTDFLLARIAEDEAVAREAISPGMHVVGWRKGEPIEEPDVGNWSAENAPKITAPGMTIYDEGDHTPEQARHIARHDPARVLAECEAKRRIVEDARDAEILSDEGTNGFVLARSVLRLLALPYADHPDYREEWKP